MRRLSFGFWCVLAVHLLAAGASAQTPLEAPLYVSGLRIPVGFEQDPANRNVQFVVQQNGLIRTILNGVLQPTPFLDISSKVFSAGECGLLGLALPPDTATSGRFYVHYSTLERYESPANAPSCATRIARYTRQTGNPLVADPGSERLLIWSPGEPFIAHPFSNHNGGQIAFGPDGYLYIGIGDGGSGNDPAHLAQNPQKLLGKILRIDVNVPDSDPQGYDIPADNPFVDNDPIAARGEIWAFGLRNPWRFSFDAPALGGSGAMLIGDVGQNALEEIDYQPPNRGGRNYGWRNWEGTRANQFHNTLPLAFEPPVFPVTEYGRSEGFSVTGGFVYRGTELGSFFQGRYFYADYETARVWSIRLTLDPLSGEATASDRREHTADISRTLRIGAITSFGRDASGELYIVSYDGFVFRIGRAALAAPRLLDPTVGAVGPTPAFRWQSVTGGTAYQLWVNDATGTRISTWFNAAALGCGSECQVTPNLSLVEGPVTWWVRTWNAEQGEGPWSPGTTVLRAPLAAAVLVSPQGTIDESSPLFTWQAVPGSTHYYLWINHGSGNRFDQWYSAADVGCPMGTATCSIRPPVTVGGDGVWWIQPWSATRGFGRWSAGMSFRRTPLAAPVLVSPSGQITDTAPEYRWAGVAGATHYLLWVNDSTGTRVQTWYNVAEVGCAASGTTCSIRPAVPIAGGAAIWWVQAWSADRGFGLWSAGMPFRR